MNEFTQEEIGQILQAGLEKTAYEQGMEEYGDALEKVASVHDVDPMELHEFLDKEAATKKYRPTSTDSKMKNMKNKALNNMQGLKDVKRNVGGTIGDLVGKAKENPAKAGLAGLGAAGAATGAGIGIKKLIDKKKNKDDKEKEASAFGLDGETYEFLLNQGIEALSE